MNVDQYLNHTRNLNLNLKMNLYLDLSLNQNLNLDLNLNQDLNLDLNLCQVVSCQVTNNPAGIQITLGQLHARAPARSADARDSEGANSAEERKGNYPQESSRHQLRMTLAAPSPNEIPFFKGCREPGDPQFLSGTAETDVEQWLRYLNAFFDGEGITEDAVRIQKLLHHTDKKLGDARLVISALFDDPSNRFLSYEEISTAIKAQYVNEDSASFVEAARSATGDVKMINECSKIARNIGRL
ncbi:hypothetical protein FHG87_007058 [Trinorchestia longiramus]|nr:hypothetical protein FHG87_007058 [Trinorchestia longiramus]